MTENFSDDVQAIVGPVLSKLGFTLDAINDCVDEGGRDGSVVYYRSDDCKVQIYESAREGSVNCMIAPLDAENEFGPLDRSYKWQYFTRFIPAPDVPLEKMVKSVSFDIETDSERLEWVRDRISNYFEAARSGILEMFGKR